MSEHREQALKSIPEEITSREPHPSSRSCLDDPRHPRSPSRRSNSRFRPMMIGARRWWSCSAGAVPCRIPAAPPSREDHQPRKRSMKRKRCLWPTSRRPKRSVPISDLLLPGNITPLTEASIFARAAGYLKKRYVDIGDRVAPGSCWPRSTHRSSISRWNRRARASRRRGRSSGRPRRRSCRPNRSSSSRHVTLDRWKILVSRGVLGAPGRRPEAGRLRERRSERVRRPRRMCARRRITCTPAKRT